MAILNIKKFINKLKKKIKKNFLILKKNNQYI